MARRFVAVVWLAAGTGAAQSLLFNGGFERGGNDWQLSGDAQPDSTEVRSGHASLRIRNGSARQDIAAPPAGAKLTCTAALKVHEVQKTADAGYAYTAIYQLDDFDDIITAQDFFQVAGTSDWQKRKCTFAVAEGCQTISVRCGLFQATGTAWFDDFTLVAGEQGQTFAQLAAAEEAVAKGLGLEPGRVGAVAIFKDDIPPAGTPASPDYLARVLRGADVSAALLNSAQLADPQCLNRSLFDVVLLPYGASFPVRAADNFRRFLREGGKFFSTGGYAFDNLLERTPNGWKAPTPARPSETDHVIWHCAIPAAELRGQGRLMFSGWLKAGHVRGPGMAFFAVYQIAADGSLPQWTDVCKVTGSQDWKEFRYTFAVDPKAVTVDLRAGLFRCHGVACFDDILLTDEAGRVVLQADFEKNLDPDRPGPRRWIRSHPQFCEVQTRTRHAGQRALKARLDFELPREERLNTRHGRPEDGLEVAPTQLGVFQVDYVLERVRSAQAAPGQRIVEPSVRLDGELQGYAASGVVGFDHARWIPLLNAYDRYGRLRGAAGALLRHYAGSYAGSSWAFFGVTNRDLFAESEPAMAGALASVVRSLVKDAYLASLVTDQACYRPNEEVEVLATLFNGGRNEASLRLSVEVYDGEPSEPEERARREPSATPPGLGVRQSSGALPQSSGRRKRQRTAALQDAGAPEPAPSGFMAGERLRKERATVPQRPLATLTATVALEPGRTNLVCLRWKPPALKSDFWHLIGRLFDGDQEVDRIESGFVFWNEKTVASGPRLDYRDNYLRFGQRPLFLFGTDDWGYVFNTPSETPLQWLRDMRQRRDLGVMIYENLQFGLPKSAPEQERLLREVDGLVQLAQKNDQVYFPCLLCGYNVAVSDVELARHTEFCRAFAQRYARVPGLIYYLNGDLRCALSDAVTPQWNEFLRERYGTTANLRAAWRDRAPAVPLGQIPAEDFNDWGHAWDDMKVYDQNRFRAWLIRRWSSALIGGIRQHDTAHPTTAEFYQLPHQGVDIPAGIDGLDLSNFGYFDRPQADLARFPAISKFNDQRVRGKSFGPGEYGAKTHPAWGDGKDYLYHITRTREQAIELFLAIAHYSLGLGASRIQNWCWKDDAHRVFPWGMVYPCDNVPKDIAYVHRNQSLLFRHFAPVYREPSVYVLTADGHRFGGGKWQVIEGILTGMDLALATRVENLGTLNEVGLNIPRPAKVIFYPLPFCPPDEVYAKLHEWVRRGGVLYLSGDISYDEFRQRTRLGRLEELCGVRFLAERYANISLNATNAEDQPCIRVEPVGARVLRRAKDGAPLVLDHRVGRGRVLFSTDPAELHSVPARRPADLALYRQVLQTAGVPPIGLDLDDPLLRVFRLPLGDGGMAYVLFNTDEGRPSRKVRLTDCHPPITLTVARQRPALLWFDGRRALRAVETQGACEAGAQLVAEDSTKGMMLTLDGKDVRQSRAVVLMPLKPGTVRLRSTVRWRAPIIEAGEIEGGAWRTFESVNMTPREGELIVTVTADQAFSLLLLCEQADASRWRSSLERAMTDPASLP